MLAMIFYRVSRVTYADFPSPNSDSPFGRIVRQMLHGRSSDLTNTYVTSTIVHPEVDDTPDPAANPNAIKAKIGECADPQWPSELTALFHQGGRPMEPMSIRNSRKGSLTLQKLPVEQHKRNRWTIAPGATWKTSTRAGQRWLFADGHRCLFYVTAGAEPLRMVVHSQ